MNFLNLFRKKPRPPARRGVPPRLAELECIAQIQQELSGQVHRLALQKTGTQNLVVQTDTMLKIQEICRRWEKLCQVDLLAVRAQVGPHNQTPKDRRAEIHDLLVILGYEPNSRFRYGPFSVTVLDEGEDG